MIHQPLHFRSRSSSTVSCYYSLATLVNHYVTVELETAAVSQHRFKHSNVSE